MGAPDLISIDEARERVLAEVEPLGAERVAPALSRVLAEPAVAREDLPPFDASAMDGFAVPGGEAGTLKLPEGVVLTASGQVFIGDTGNNRILKKPVAGGSVQVLIDFDQPAGLR